MSGHDKHNSRDASVSALVCEDSEFPFLLRAMKEDMSGKGEEHANGFRPQDVDDLAVELRKLFEMCGVPEANDECPSRTKCLMFAFHGFYKNLVRRAVDGGRNDKALLRLLQDVITTPRNLENLLRAAQGAFRTGPVRCVATVVLTSLPQEVPSIWSVKLSDGSRFLSSFIVVLSESLHDEVKVFEEMKHFWPRNINGENVCDCTERKFLNLLAALQWSKEKPGKTIDLIHPFDWANMFQLETKDVRAIVIVFRILHEECVSLLLEKGRNEKAVAFLQKLGSCHKLFRRVLHVVASGQLCSSSSSREIRQRDIKSVLDFVEDFNHCLSHLPQDGGTLSLVAKAYHSLRRSIKVLDRHDRPSWEDTLRLLEPQYWKRRCRSHPTDDELWEKFRNNYLVGDSKHNKLFKESRRSSRAHQTKYFERPSHPCMCANCFVMDGEHEEALKQCSRCKIVTYCSRECQLQHWKKTHKFQCNK